MGLRGTTFLLFAIVVAGKIHVQAGDCLPPIANCTCIGSAFHPKYKFECKGLITIPTNLSSGYDLVSIQDGEIPIIKEGSFIGIEPTKRLELLKNAIKTIEPGAFGGLISLISLKLSENALHSIQNGTFVGLQSLRALYLSQNKIKLIEKGGFAGLKKLSQLDLNWNRLKYMSTEAFQDLKALSMLYLSHNKITEPSIESLEVLPSLRLLHLENNSIHHLEEGLFNKSRKIFEINLSGNRIQTVETILNGLSRLYRLKLSNNMIKWIHSDTFTGLSSLRYLYLDSNKIQGIHKKALKDMTFLRYLYLRNNSITHLDEGIFNNTRRLYKVDLFINRLQNIGNIFRGLQYLVSLDLAKNNFKWIGMDAFRGLKSLQYLYLLNNTIENIQKQAFKDLHSLRYILVSHNNIEVLQEGVFIGFSSIRALVLTNNKLRNVTKDMLMGVSRYIYELFLDNNEIEVIEPGAFRTLRFLRYLYLHKNNIAHLQYGALQIPNVYFLYRLYLTENNFKILRPQPFDGLKIMDFLYLRSCGIREIKPGTFRGLMARKIYLENNEISVLERGTFNGSITRHIFLDNSNIADIEPEAFAGIRVLIVLDNSNRQIKDLRKSRQMQFWIRGYSLENNKLTAIRPGVFDKYLPIAGSLRLARNKLQFIGNDSFRGLDCTEIDISDNEIKYVEPNAFHHYSFLYLYLAGNYLKTFKEGTFDTQSGLNRLSLHDNELTHLPAGLFKKIRRLKNLSLQRNRLQIIPDIAENTPLYLFVQNNYLSTLPRLGFNKTYATLLENIFLDNNRLDRILNETFYGAIAVMTITLSGNPIIFIEEGAFLYLPKLEMVNLLDTHITVPLEIWPLRSAVSYVVTEGVKANDVAVLYLRVGQITFFQYIGYVCKSTPAGFYRAFACKPCSRGTYASLYKVNVFDVVCVPCPAGGFYQEETGYTGRFADGIGCKHCPPGSYVKPERAPGKFQTDCQSCPQGTNLKAFAKFRACRCMHNYYRINRFGPCFICKKGHTCLNETINLAAGFYWVWKSIHDKERYELFKTNLLMSSQNYKIQKFEDAIPEAYACPIENSCLGGMKADCNNGYTGPLCAVCDKGFYIVMSRCRKCPSLPWIIGQMLLFAIVVGIMIAIILWEKKKNAACSTSSRSLTDIFLARLKIVIGFYQVSSSTFDSFSYIRWPSTIRTLMNYAKMVQLNLFQLIPLSCIKDTIKTDAYLQFLFSVILSGLLILAGILFSWFMKFYKRGKSADSKATEVKINEYKQKTYRCLILLLFITFPSTCTHILQMLPAACHKICSHQEVNCNSYLKADYSVQCDTSKHNIYGTLSTIAVVYCIGFPLTLFFILRRAQRQGKLSDAASNDNDPILNGLRFLHENYSPVCWFWEILELARKIFFSSLLILMNAESRTSLGLTSMFSGLYSVMFALYKPIEDTFEHWLQLASLLASSVNFTVGMLMKIPQEETSSGLDKDSDALLITILLLVANVAVILVVAVKYISSIVATIIKLKREPHCNLSCCLEIFQLVSDAQGEVTSTFTEPEMPGKILEKDDEKPTHEGHTSNFTVT